MTAVGTFALVFWLFGVLLQIGIVILFFRHFRSSPAPDAKEILPGVSILKPIKGLESDLDARLAAYFKLDYPNYELLFSVADFQDPAIPVIRDLQTRFPERAKLFVGEETVGSNPKVNNMARAYQSAKFDFIWISDSNTLVSPDSLRYLIQNWEPDVGMTTSVVAGVQAKSVAGAMERIFLNTFYAKWMLVLSILKIPCVVGKSMLFRRSLAERFGGIENLGGYLAEDFYAGRAVKFLGLKVAVSRRPVFQPIPKDYRFKNFWDRHLRWGRIRKSQAPEAFLFEPLLSSFIFGIAGWLSVRNLMEISKTEFSCLHFGIWASCEWILSKKLTGEVTAADILCWPLKEILYVVLWGAVICGNTVQWRGQKMRVFSGGLLTKS